MRIHDDILCSFTIDEFQVLESALSQWTGRWKESHNLNGAEVSHQQEEIKLRGQLLSNIRAYLEEKYHERMR